MPVRERLRPWSRPIRRPSATAKGRWWVSLKLLSDGPDARPQPIRLTEATSTNIRQHDLVAHPEGPGHGGLQGDTWVTTTMSCSAASLQRSSHASRTRDPTAGERLAALGGECQVGAPPPPQVRAASSVGPVVDAVVDLGPPLVHSDGRPQRRGRVTGPAQRAVTTRSAVTKEPAPGRGPAAWRRPNSSRGTSSRPSSRARALCVVRPWRTRYSTRRTLLGPPTAMAGTGVGPEPGQRVSGRTAVDAPTSAVTPLATPPVAGGAPGPRPRRDPGRNGRRCRPPTKPTSGPPIGVEPRNATDHSDITRPRMDGSDLELQRRVAERQEA